MDFPARVIYPFRPWMMVTEKQLTESYLNSHRKDNEKP
jgi:hypothetical protein